MAFRDIVGHERPVKWLRTAVASDHVGHAYLFHGEPAIGKRLTAIALAQYLHCEALEETPHPDACGVCRSCHQIVQVTHPDYLIIQPEDEQKQNPKITINQIRDIEHLVIYRPLVGSHKICLIDPADSLTPEAANALLKTLEDPPDHCLFLLITSRPEHLLMTIRSRCIPLRFSPLPSARLSECLRARTDRSPADVQLMTAFSEGRLGVALTGDPEDVKVKLRQYWDLLFGKPNASASRIMDISEGLVKSHQIQEAIHWFWAGLRDLFMLTLDPSSSPALYKDQEPALRQLAREMTPSSILPLMHELNQLERGQHRNLNIQIGLEQFFFHLHDQLKFAHSQKPV